MLNLLKLKSIIMDLSKLDSLSTLISPITELEKSMLEEAMNKWEDMPLKLLDGEKKMELTIGLLKTHGDLTGVIMDTSKSRWENANLIQLLFQDWLELTLSKLFLSDLISLLISF